MPRAHHEGSIYQRKDGRWVAALRIDGKRRYRYSTSEAGAVIALRQLRVEAESLIEPSATKVSEFAVDWLARKRPDLSLNTFRRYENLLRVHALPAFGSIQLKNLRPRHLNDLYRSLDRSARTIVQLHRVIYSMLKDAFRQGMVSRNVAEFVSPPKIQKYQPLVLNVAQARQLLDAARGTDLEAAWRLGLQGLRSGEILARKWDDVDFDNRRLAVTSSLTWTEGGHWHIVETKTVKSRRTIELTDGAITALRNRQRLQAEQRLRAGADWQDHGFVFTSSKGRPMRQESLLNRIFRPLLKESGLPQEFHRLRIHDLRHSLVSILLAEGMDPRFVGDYVGHSSPYTTLSMYAHMLPGEQSRATKALESLG